MNRLNPILWQKVEGIAVFIGGIIGYSYTENSWWMFAGLLLAPDIFMLGYLKGTKVGAAIYNFGHVLLLPIALIIIGAYIDNLLVIGIGFIWISHVGMDRAVGYGLKHNDNFKNTHLN